MKLKEILATQYQPTTNCSLSKKVNESFDVGSVLYHVTHTDKLPAIKKKGLLLMQTSNWVRAADSERYGAGEVYAFTNRDDAIRWGGKMDYTFNKKLGSGNISIVEFKPGDAKWEIDDADPLGQAGAKGQWVKSAKAVAPSSIVASYPVTTDLIKQATAR